MADIQFNSDEQMQATCAYRTFILVKLNLDNVESMMDDTSSEIALLQQRIAFLEKRLANLEEDKGHLSQELDTQQGFLQDVAKNAISRLGVDVALDGFDLAFSDGLVKNTVIGLTEVAQSEE